MTDRMHHYETLDNKVFNKLKKVEHLTNYNSTEVCDHRDFLCSKVKYFNATFTTDLDRMSFFIDLVIVEAIDQGNQQDVFELVLEVKKSITNPCSTVLVKYLLSP